MLALVNDHEFDLPRFHTVDYSSRPILSSLYWHDTKS